MLSEALLLIEMIGLVAGIAFAMFSLLGPVIEAFLDYVLPPEDWDDDDISPA